MPLRRARKPVGPDLNLYRRFAWGSLATFNVLDGRQYRSDQPAGCTPDQRDPRGYCPGALDPARSKLGAEQRAWLLDELATTGARWNVLAQQTAFAPFDRDPGPGRDFGAGDNWDGYVAERQQILDWIVDVDQLRGRPGHSEHHLWRRSEQPAHPADQQQPGLRPVHGGCTDLDERVPDRPHRPPARRPGLHAGDVRGRERPGGAHRVGTGA